MEAKEKEYQHEKEIMELRSKTTINEKIMVYYSKNLR